MIWSVWGDFFNVPPTISESHGPSETLLVLPIELHQDSAFDSPEDEQRIRRSENDVLRCFESPGAELGVGDVVAMLPGISKRPPRRSLRRYLRRERLPAVKRAALICTSKRGFCLVAGRSRTVRALPRLFAIRSRFRRVQGRSPWIRLAGARAMGDWDWQARDGRFLGLLQGVVVPAEMGVERKPGFFQISRIKAL